MSVPFFVGPDALHALSLLETLREPTDRSEDVVEFGDRLGEAAGSAGEDEPTALLEP